MKFIAALLLTTILAFAGALFFPWWIIAVVAFIVAVVIPQTPFKSFISGFTALFILWGVQAAFIDTNNNHLLATRIAKLLPLGGSYLALMILTSFIGGLVAGLAALTGSFLHAAAPRTRR